MAILDTLLSIEKKLGTMTQALDATASKDVPMEGDDHGSAT
jgi:hypothetical protein